MVCLSARVGSIGDNYLGGWFGYRASKSALNQIVKTASVEFNRKKSKLILAAIHPGTVFTKLSKPFAKKNSCFTTEQAAKKILNVISNLKIDTEDSVIIMGKTYLANFSIDLNFFSQSAQRSILINGNNFTLKADLINNSIEIFKMKRKKSIKFNIDNNYSYKEQHKSILSNNYKNSCSYNEGLKLMLLFNKIKNFKK